MADKIAYLQLHELRNVLKYPEDPKDPTGLAARMAGYVARLKGFGYQIDLTVDRKMLPQIVLPIDAGIPAGTRLLCDKITVIERDGTSTVIRDRNAPTALHVNVPNNERNWTMVKEIVSSQLLEQMIGTGEATSTETHDMAVELLCWRSQHNHPSELSSHLVPVKTLDWVHGLADRYFAETPFGDYVVRLETKRWWTPHRDDDLGNIAVGDPREAAQAHYERSIRSALADPPPQPKHRASSCPDDEKVG